MQREFFAPQTEEVAKKLLGCVLEKDGMRAKIVETEAYLEDDPASHAYSRKTPRNKLMYETHGKVYVYICYGIHHMLNFTADSDGVGGVLIRAAEPLEGLEEMKENREVGEKERLCDGPGKICEALDIDKDLNGTEVGGKIKLEEGETPEYEVSTRIGISKAQDRELRYYVSGNSYVSER